MKQKLKYIVLIPLIVLLLAGCKKEIVVSDKHAILFQLDYVNNAWGSQHNGFMIDNKGNVLSYDNPENWNFPSNDLIINESLVNENLSKCIATGNKITEEELHKYSHYINNIASSKVTALMNVAADAGSLDFICYKFSEKTNTYKGYLIKKEGDFTCENLNFYSKKVVAWMKDIGDNIVNN